MRLSKYQTLFYIAVITIFAAYLASNIVGYVLSNQLNSRPINFEQSAAPVQSSANIVSNIVERNLLSIETVRPSMNADSDTTEQAGATSGASSTTTQAAQAAPFTGKLTGILLAEPVSESLAIIVDNKNNVHIVNSHVEEDGYILKTATIDTATIAYNGVEHQLNIVSSVTGRAAITPPPREVIPPRVAEPAPAEVAEEEKGTEHVTLERSQITDQLKDINSVLTSLLVTPHLQDGEFLGYRIASMREDSPVRALGLDRGDIISRINGEEASPELLINMMNDVNSVAAISLDVIRNGEKKTLFIEIQ